jgi:hypothetical protein
MLGRSNVNKIITIGTAFLLGVGAGLIIQSKDWASFLTSYIPALATLVAAFYGAKFAFEFQNNKELEAEKNHNIVAVNRAIFTLSRMANNLFLYQKDFINPVRNKQAAFLDLRPTLEMEKELIKLDAEALYFLLDTDFRNLLGEVVIEDERYRAAIDAINIRSNLHLQHVQPMLEKAGFKSGITAIVSELELEGVLGNRLYSTIKESTDQVIFHVDSTVESLKQVAEKLKDSIKTIYPDEKVIKFVLSDNATK